METIETLIESNLLIIGSIHIGIVAILLVIFLSARKGDDEEVQEEDEDVFDYGIENEAMFKPSNDDGMLHQPPDDEDEEEDAGGIFLKKPKLQEKEEEEDSDLGEPVVFNSEIQEEAVVDQGAAMLEEVDSIEPEKIVPEEDTATVKSKAEIIVDLLQEKADSTVIIISREEDILAMSETAKNEFQFSDADYEGKKIDDIVFLEPINEEDTQDGRRLQRAKGKRKDDSQFPLNVELEMANREHGLILVNMLLLEEKPPEEPEPEISETPTPEPETEAIEPIAPEVAIDEPEPVEAEPVETIPAADIPVPVEVPAPRKPLPPPPRPKPKLKKQDAQSTAQGGPNTKLVDTKTMEMISSQLNQPLQSIVQLAELISSDENAIPHLKKYAVAIQAKSNRMMSQIEEMSTLVNAQKNQIALAEKPFHLSKLVSNIVDLSSGVAGNDQTLKYQADESELVVMGDEPYFEKILTNLINLTMTEGVQETPEEIRIELGSELVNELEDSSKTVEFEGDNLNINAIREIRFKVSFSSENTNTRFFDICFNRSDDSIAHKLEVSNELKSQITTIRLIKQLAINMGGKIAFHAHSPSNNQFDFQVKLPCLKVAQYPE